MTSSWNWHGDVAAVRATRRWRRYVRTPGAGYDYYPSAVPGMVATVADTAGKGDYQDSEDYCQN